MRGMVRSWFASGTFELWRGLLQTTSEIFDEPNLFEILNQRFCLHASILPYGRDISRSLGWRRDLEEDYLRPHGVVRVAQRVLPTSVASSTEPSASLIAQRAPNSLHELIPSAS